MNINTDLICSNVDLVDLAQKAGSTMSRAGKDYRGNCPLHGGKNRNNFVVYTKAGKQLWKCFSNDCGQGDAIEFVMKWLNYDFMKACNYLTGGKILDKETAQRLAKENAERQAQALREEIERAEQALEALRQANNWEKYYQYAISNEKAIETWESHGIPEIFIHIWNLGYDPDHFITYKDGNYTSPTLAIPIFDRNKEVKNIRHRILYPTDSGDKYRPERANLPPSLFLANPELKKGNEKFSVVIEGEKKSMVTYITLDNPDIQAIGTPGKNSPDNLIIEETKNSETVFLCYDPDASIVNKKTGISRVEQLALEIGNRAVIVELPGKIDDLIIQYGIDKDKLMKIFIQGRRYAKK